MTMTIDIGDKHTCLCFYSNFYQTYDLYLCNFDYDNIQDKLTSIFEQLNNITYSLQTTIRKVIVEKQMNFATNNIRTESYVLMMLYVLSRTYNFTLEEQNPKLKYKIFGAHKKEALKTLAAQYVAQNFIDQDKVIVKFNCNFGQGSSRRNQNGEIRRCRWYSDKTFNFCSLHNIDKLDDIADTILMQLLEQKEQEKQNKQNEKNK